VVAARKSLPFVGLAERATQSILQLVYRPSGLSTLRVWAMSRSRHL